MRDRSETTLEVSGHRLNAVVRGEGPGVLLVHGLGATSHIWDRVGPLLTGFRTVAVDLPGSGHSDASKVDGIPGLAALLDALMQSQGFSRYGVAGHSLGGVIALELALLFPERVKAAALLNAAVRLPPIARLGAMPRLGDAIFKVPALTPVSRAATKLYLMTIFGKARAVTDEVVENYLHAAEAPGYFDTMLQGLRGLNAWTHGGRLHDLRVPTAVLWGAKDPLFPMKEGRRVAASLPGARLFELPRCGHCPPEEDPVKVAEILSQLFSRLAPTAAPRKEA